MCVVRKVFHIKITPCLWICFYFDWLKNPQKSKLNLRNLFTFFKFLARFTIGDNDKNVPIHQCSEHNLCLNCTLLLFALLGEVQLPDLFLPAGSIRWLSWLNTNTSRFPNLAGSIPLSINLDLQDLCITLALHSYWLAAASVFCADVGVIKDYLKELPQIVQSETRLCVNNQCTINTENWIGSSTLITAAVGIIFWNISLSWEIFKFSYFFFKIFFSYSGCY